MLLTSSISSHTLCYKGRNTLKLFFLEKEFHLKILLLLKQQILLTMLLILEKVYIKLLNVPLFLTRIFCNLHVFDGCKFQLRVSAVRVQLIGLSLRTSFPFGSLRSWRYCVSEIKVWSPLVTAPPSNLTRLYYNGSAAKSHSTTMQYRQLRRLSIWGRREKSCESDTRKETREREAWKEIFRPLRLA